MTFYNVDEINIYHQTLYHKFNEKSLKKVYKKYSIKKDECVFILIQ